ncbi:unnamed protein product, partial [Albugo candida]
VMVYQFTKINILEGWNFVKSGEMLDSIGKILPSLANSYEQRNLSLFYQLMLRCIAPTLLKNDHWIHHISGGPFITIPVHHCSTTASRWII